MGDTVNIHIKSNKYKGTDKKYFWFKPIKIMANVVFVTVYQLNSYTYPNPYQNGASIGIGVSQIKNVLPVTGVPSINGTLIYSVIQESGTIQYPGPKWYTGLTVYQVQQLTG